MDSYSWIWEKKCIGLELGLHLQVSVEITQTSLMTNAITIPTQFPLHYICVWYRDANHTHDSTGSSPMTHTKCHWYILSLIHVPRSVSMVPPGSLRVAYGAANHRRPRVTNRWCCRRIQSPSLGPQKGSQWCVVLLQTVAYSKSWHTVPLGTPR